MTLEPNLRTPFLDNAGKKACDDALVSHRPGSGKCLRIILADDHPVVLKGAEMALSAPSGGAFTVVALASNADELISQLKCTPCDLVISDYSMPYGCFPDGLALMGYLRRHFSHIPLMVMTVLRNPSLLRALLNGGVRGLFDKRSPLGELKRAADNVSRGRQHLCPALAAILDAQRLPSSNAPSVNLSERELEVVRLFVQGMSGRQIAAQLNRSEKTISRQKRTAMDKLGLGHDGGLVEFARVSGLG